MDFGVGGDRLRPESRIAVVESDLNKPEAFIGHKRPNCLADLLSTSLRREMLEDGRRDEDVDEVLKTRGHRTRHVAEDGGGHRGRVQLSDDAPRLFEILRRQVDGAQPPDERRERVQVRAAAGPPLHDDGRGICKVSPGRRCERLNMPE